MSPTLTRVLLYLYRLGLVCLIVPFGYWLRKDIGHLAFGGIMEWSLATILLYAPLALYFELRPKALKRVGISVVAGFIVSLPIPDPAGTYIFGMVYGPLLAVAAYWNRPDADLIKSR